MKPRMIRLVVVLTVLVAALGAGLSHGVSGQQNPYPPQYQAAGTVQPMRDLTPGWTSAIPGDVISAAVAADGSCVALVTQQPLPGRILLFDRNGARAWDVAPPQVITSPVAVAPGCAFVAFDASRDQDIRMGMPKGTVGLQRRGGPPVAIAVEGRPNSIAISHASDLVAIGTEGRTNIFLASPDGRMVRAIQRFSGTAPQLSFSADDGFIVVRGWYGVGVMTRAGDSVWGPWPMSAQAKRGDWRRIDASRDLQWFAAEQGPMHGPDAGTFALLSSTGEVAWQGPPVWGADVKMAPDGSYFVAVGRERRLGTDIDDGAPARVAVMDRAGRVLASTTMPRPTLEAISPDGRFILMREIDGRARVWLVGRDRALAPAWRVGPADGYYVHAESGLILSWAAGRVSGYMAPR
jgi:hypothetical protein